MKENISVAKVATFTLKNVEEETADKNVEVNKTEVENSDNKDEETSSKDKDPT